MAQFAAPPKRKGIAMSLVAEREMEHIGETQGMENHDHDPIQDLNRRLDALWRYDQYIANADGHPQLQKLWRELKNQEQQNVKRLKECVAKEVEHECF
jgi:hypothetical protein